MKIHLRSLCGVLLLAAFVVACKDKAPPVSDATPPDPSMVEANGSLSGILKVAPLTLTPIGDVLRVAARIDFDQHKVTRIGSSVVGRVSELSARLGQHVEPGDTLAVLNSTELGVAQLAYLKSRAQAELSARNVERAAQLLAADVIGRAEVQRRENELAIARAEQRAAADQLRVLGVTPPAIQRLGETGAITSVTPVVATIRGSVVERKVAQGQVVQPSDVLFVVADLSRVWVVAEVPESQAGVARVGQTTEVEVPALGARLNGKLVFIADTVDPQTRTVTMYGELDNPNRDLKPAMLATVLIKSRPEPRLVVPAAAVVRENDSDNVFVEASPGRYRLTSVKLGPALGEMRPVLSGLAEGQNVVIDGAFHLNNERKRKELE